MNEDLRVRLDDQRGTFVEAQVASGRFDSADSVLSALIEGEESGPPGPFDFESFIAGKLATGH